MTWPLQVHVAEVMNRVYLPQLMAGARPPNDFVRPGEVADATIIALVERENNGIYDLPWRRPYIPLATKPPLASDEEVTPMLRRHWRDWVINDVPIPGTLRGFLYALRGVRRDSHAAYLIASTMEWERGRNFAINHDFKSLKILWRYRPWMVDLVGAVTVLGAALLIVGG